MAVGLCNLQKTNISFISQDTLKKAARDTVIILLCFYSMFTVIKTISWRNNAALWQELVERYPDNPNAHRELGYVFAEGGLLNRAIDECKIAIRLDPRNAKNYNTIGFCYYKKGMIDEATMSFEKTLELDPSLLDAYNNLGGIFASKGLYEEAENYFRKAIAIDPKYFPAYKNLGAIYVRMKRWDEARKIWREVLEINPYHKDIRIKLEQLSLLQQRPE